MTGVILQTKLHIPSLRPAHIQRSQLLNKLNDRLQGENGRFSRKLTLVSAPPGFGKTTLISSWLHQLNQPATWLSLDAADNEPSRFIYYVIAALQRLDQELGDSALALLQSPQPPAIETLLTLLINDLAGMPGQAILVLDDYHVVQELAIHKALTFLLANQPAQLHLVIISREDPALPLHRMRGSGQMMGIYIKDLRFSVQEAATFLNKTMGLDLMADEIAALERRTEGWVAGLQLAALSLQDMPDTHEFVTTFAGDDRYITDYLFAEVIDRLPANIQSFLQKTAITDRFCASLCDALIGFEDLGADTNTPSLLPSKTIIEQLDRGNLFIVALDSKREWYRYHHLFADFLRLNLQHQPASFNADLHRRAAKWYDQHGFIEEAIKHYLAANDFTQVAIVIERVAIRLIAQGQLRMVLDWLEELPAEFVVSRPLLCVCQAWILNITGQAAASEPLLQQAERALTGIEPGQARHIKGLMDMIRAYQARRQGNLPGSITLLRQASENLSASDLLVRSTVNLNLGFNYLLMGDLSQAEEVLQAARGEGEAAGAVYITLIAIAVQGNNYFAQGKLRRATVSYEEAINYGLARNQGRPFPPAGYAYAGLGQVLYEQNELEPAARFLTIAVELGKSISDWSMVRRGLLPLAWLKEMNGDSVAAQKLWQQALEVVQQAGSERLETRLRALWTRMQLVHGASDSGALASAADWAGTYREHQPEASNYQEAPAQMTLAQVELAQGEVDQAIQRLERLAEAASAGGQNDNLIKIRALLALVYDARGEEARALEELDQALTLGTNEGYVRTFIDHGLPMQRLLREATSRGIASDYAASLLAEYPTELQEEKQPTSSQDDSPWIEPLTESELSIVRLMAAGLSNREIADELFLSVNTIKVYASRAYAKLGVHRRGEAVALAREYDLI